MYFTSIGSLGQNNSTGIVERVVLDNAYLLNTTNGLRIKTWQVILMLFDLNKIFFRRNTIFLHCSQPKLLAHVRVFVDCREVLVT